MDFLEILEFNEFDPFFFLFFFSPSSVTNSLSVELVHQPLTRPTELSGFLISRAEQLMRIRNCEVNLAVAVFAATLHQIHPRTDYSEKNV